MTHLNNWIRKEPYKYPITVETMANLQFFTRKIICWVSEKIGIRFKIIQYLEIIERMDAFQRFDQFVIKKKHGKK